MDGLRWPVAVAQHAQTATGVATGLVPDTSDVRHIDFASKRAFASRDPRSRLPAPDARSAAIMLPHLPLFDVSETRSRLVREAVVRRSSRGLHRAAPAAPARVATAIVRQSLETAPHAQSSRSFATRAYQHNSKHAFCNMSFETWVGLLRNGLCVISDTLPEEYQQFGYFENGMSTLNALIAPLQFAAALFNLRGASPRGE